MPAEKVAWVVDWGWDGIGVLWRGGKGGGCQKQQGENCDMRLVLAMECAIILTNGLTSSPAFVTLSQNQVATWSSPQCGSSSS